jgi:pyruvate/2-oxoglutarate dehydrogenase complex dihydrolipoamide dehydrogenase (E3) component
MSFGIALLERNATMTDTLRPDICVIGGGSGGLTVAAAAAAFGVEVVLVESGKMGGDCLNYGCVPSKALIAAAKHAHAVGDAPRFGISAGEVTVDFRKVHDHIHGVIGAIAPNDSAERFTALGVKVIQAQARFSDDRTVVAGGTEIKARRFVVATGSRPFVPPIPGLDTVDYLTNETLFDRKRPIRRLIIVGGGPIGMEMAQAYRRLGSEVVVIEGLKALGKDDPELAAIVLDTIRREGVEILEETKVTEIGKRGSVGVRVSVETKDGKSVIEGSHILVATGRAANVDDLGLEAAGIRFDGKGIKVGANLRTTNSRVYAVGDVAGSLQFTHVAGYHASLVVKQILFRLPAKENRTIIPWVTFTDPELAHVGLSEEQARKKSGSIKVMRWPYAENDRARAEGRTVGHIKIVADRKGGILGVTIAGADAGEMINLWALAISKNMKTGDISGYIPPYPTLSEIGRRAVIASYAPLTRKPFVRRLIRFLRRFG